MGGLAAASAIARGGDKVTLLDAAKELGEIGAGIQMFPNVSRLLIRWGVDELIGNNLIVPDEYNTWDADNQLIARFDPKWGAKQSGFPHWLVRRDHLHGFFLTQFLKPRRLWLHSVEFCATNMSSLRYRRPEESSGTPWTSGSAPMDIYYCIHYPQEPN